MDQGHKTKVQVARYRKKLQRKIQAQEVLLVRLIPEDYATLKEYRETVSRVKNKLGRLRDELENLKTERIKMTMLNGTIKNVFYARGFGFIVPEEGEEEDVFFHMSVLEGVWLEELSKGDKISYEAEEGDKGPRATLVMLA